MTTAPRQNAIVFASARNLLRHFFYVGNRRALHLQFVYAAAALKIQSSKRRARAHLAYHLLCFGARARHNNDEAI